jgi:hypothetical protein
VVVDVDDDDDDDDEDIFVDVVVDNGEDRVGDVEFSVATKEAEEEEEEANNVDDKKGEAVPVVFARMSMKEEEEEDGDNGGGDIDIGLENSRRATNDWPADMHRTSCARRVGYIMMVGTVAIGMTLVVG